MIPFQSVQEEEEALYEYARLHSSPLSPLLQNLERQAHLRLLQPRMLSGALQGLFLQMFCSLLKPQNVLELGAYSGYSTLALAEAVGPTARVHSIECNDELAPFLNEFIAQSPAGERITLHFGRALDLLPEVMRTYPFDLVYIDADKREYPQYYELIAPLLRSGAWIIADNTLWSGKVLDPNPDPKDLQGQGIRTFNRLVAQDSTVRQLLLPLRDGLTLIQKL